MAGIKIKLRFDYTGRVKSGKLFGNKNLEQLASDTREHKVAMMRNVPSQGIRIEDIDMSQDIYSIVDDITGRKTAYAPVTVTFYADSLADAIKFVVQEEFRTVEIIEPEEVLLSGHDMEKLLFSVNEALSAYREYLVRKIDILK